MKIKKILWFLALTVLVGLVGCAGSGDDGANGLPGQPGQDAVDTGTLSGKVVDSSGSPVVDATVETSPATATATTDAEGLFSLPNVRVGAYTCTASKTGMGSSHLVVGVAGGGTTNVTLTLESQAGASLARIAGTVLDVNGVGVVGATVSVEGQSATATTGADGTFSLMDVEPGFVYLYVTAPSAAYLDGETLSSILVQGSETVADVAITLSGRPSDAANTVGGARCQACHGEMWSEIFAAFDGSPSAAVHSRFVTEGTSHMVYPELWPAPGEAYLPRDPTRGLLMVQDPLDGTGLVNVVLCTQDGAGGREYLFKFYAELGEGADPRTEAQLDCVADATAVFIPVAATIGGEGNWGEGYVDSQHATTDRDPNFGEGKQRYMCRMQDVPWLREWAVANGVTNWLDDDYVDFVAYMPVYLYQDATPAGSAVLTGANDVGGPKFWQKSPTHWAYPANTLSRNCAGCHSTGIKTTKVDFPDAHEAGDAKQVVTNFEYKDLNITCERCHGPGSEHAAFPFHKTKIISPKYLTAKAGNELCGQCHGSHAGKSQRPEGIHKYPYDANYENSLGNGFFVPGVHDLATFYANYDLPTSGVKDNWQEGTFHTWPDQTHSRAHSQELSEMRRSVHYNNSYEKLTCYTCHDAHGLDAGPASLSIDGYAFGNAAYGNNTLCLACHATHGPFEEVSKEDVAVLQLDAGRTVTLDGEAVSVAAADSFLARNRVGRAVAEHMQTGAGMGGALYTPSDLTMPVGNCASCHMAKIGKLQDVNDDAQWHLAFDQNGLSAVAEGNTASHVFDIVWPAQSAVLAPFATHDYDIMPNSCSKCHDFARISGDSD